MCITSNEREVGLPVQSCRNLLKINQKYDNSYISNSVKPHGKPSGPTFCFLEKYCFVNLQYQWFSKFGLLWNFLFGHIPNTVIHHFKHHSIDSLSYHVVLQHNDKNSCPELIDLRLIGPNHFDDPRDR
jgi:hypothetical protein